MGTTHLLLATTHISHGVILLKSGPAGASLIHFLASLPDGKHVHTMNSEMPGANVSQAIPKFPETIYRSIDSLPGRIEPHSRIGNDLHEQEIHGEDRDPNFPTLKKWSCRWWYPWHQKAAFFWDCDRLLEVQRLLRQNFGCWSIARTRQRCYCFSCRVHIQGLQQRAILIRWFQ